MAEAAREKRVSSKIYVGVWLALLVLTITTLLLGKVKLGAFSLPVAMLIAVTKSTLVVLFYMHLVEHRGGSRLALPVSILFLLLLMTFVVLDTITRYPPVKPGFLERQFPQARPAPTRYERERLGAPPPHHFPIP